MKFRVQVVPAAGKGETKETKVEASPNGVAVSDVLSKANVRWEKASVTVNGQSVTGDTHVTDGATIVVNERVAGS